MSTGSEEDLGVVLDSICPSVFSELLALPRIVAVEGIDVA